jgi:DHA1 family tetracycline resistance protein-like MFS transporter
VSRRTAPASQGVTLGAFQSAGALSRVLGPAGGGLLYQNLGRAAPYFLGSGGMIVAAALALALDPAARPPGDDLAPLAKEQGECGI